MGSNLARQLYVHGSCGYAEAGGTSASSPCSGAADSSPAFLDLHWTFPGLTPMGKAGAHTGHTAGTWGHSQHLWLRGKEPLPCGLGSLDFRC